LIGVQIAVLSRCVESHASPCGPSLEGDVAIVSVAGASVSKGFARVGWLLQIDDGLVVATPQLSILHCACLLYPRLHDTCYWVEK
jgi:hypothetical protein